MAHTLTVDLGERSYPIVIGKGMIGGTADLAAYVPGRDCLVVTNTTVGPLYGEKLLTTPNPRANADLALFGRLGIEPEERQLERAPEAPSPLFYDAAVPAARGDEAAPMVSAAG